MSHDGCKNSLSYWLKIKIISTKMFRLVKKMYEVKKNLKIWNKNVFYRKNYMKEKLEKI